MISAKAINEFRTQVSTANVKSLQTLARKVRDLANEHYENIEVTERFRGLDKMKKEEIVEKIESVLKIVEKANAADEKKTKEPEVPSVTLNELVKTYPQFKFFGPHKVEDFVEKYGEETATVLEDGDEVIITVVKHKYRGYTDQPELPVRKAEDTVPVAAGKMSERYAYGDHIITLKVTENPKKPGTHAHKRFSMYRDGMTVKKYIEKGGLVRDIYWDTKVHNIKLTAPKA